MSWSRTIKVYEGTTPTGGGLMNDTFDAIGSTTIPHWRTSETGILYIEFDAWPDITTANACLMEGRADDASPWFPALYAGFGNIMLDLSSIAAGGPDFNIALTGIPTIPNWRFRFVNQNANNGNVPFRAWVVL